MDRLEQLSLDPIDLLDVISTIQKHKLDFDDSYQLIVAQKYDLTLITFDRDFNVKGIQKNSPDEIVQKQ